MPPAIHRTMMESAVASGAAARTSWGSVPVSAARLGAAVTPRPMNPMSSRRLIFDDMNLSSAFMGFLNGSSLTEQLKLRGHQDGPEQVGEAIGGRFFGIC